jgi:hypothetical protein
MKNSKIVILSLILLASSKINASQEEAALLARQNPQDIDPDMAKAIADSMNPYDIDPDLAKAMAASLADSTAQPSVGGGQAAQSPREMSEEEQLAAALLASQNPYDIDPDMARAIASSLAESTQQPSASGGQSAQIARPISTDSGDLTEEELRQIEAQNKADQEFEASLEQLGKQGQYYLEVAEPQILEVDGQKYTIRQLFTLRQSKVTGRFAQCLPDETCFAQSTKNASAILAYKQRADETELAPLAFMPAAQERLEQINQRMRNTEIPKGDTTQPDQISGNFDEVTVEFGSKVLTEGQAVGSQLLQNLIILNQKGLKNLIKPRTAEAQEEDAQMLANDGAAFFNLYQISNNALNIIDDWRNGHTNTIGIILQTEGHYITIVFDKTNPEDIEVLVADSTFEVNRVNDAWMTNEVYLPLIELLQKTDLTPWLSALEEGRQVKEDQGGGFSLFD